MNKEDNKYQQGWVPRSKISEIISESRKFFESATEGTYAMIFSGMFLLSLTIVLVTWISFEYTSPETYRHCVIVPKEDKNLLESYQRDGYSLGWIYDSHPYIKLEKEYRVEPDKQPTITESAVEELREEELGDRWQEIEGAD